MQVQFITDISNNEEYSLDFGQLFNESKNLRIIKNYKNLERKFSHHNGIFKERLLAVKNQQSSTTVATVQIQLWKEIAYKNYPIRGNGRVLRLLRLLQVTLGQINLIGLKNIHHSIMTFPSSRKQTGLTHFTYCLLFLN